MRKVYFETDNAILRIDYDDVVEKLPYYESVFGSTEATVLRNLLTSADHGITVQRELYRFAYFALNLIEQGKGVVYCKGCKRYYEAKELKRGTVGHGESLFSINIKGRGWLRILFAKKRRLPFFGRRGYACPEGHELFEVVTWRT